MKTALELKSEGNDAFQAENYEEAIARYNEALAIDNTMAAAWYNIGQCHSRLNNFEEALHAYDQALNCQPDYAKATFGKAIALEKLGQVNASWELLKSLLARDDLAGSFEEKVILEEFRLKQTYQAKVAYVCVDLKYTETGECKILEFGSGFQSALDGHKAVSETPFEQLFRDIVRQERLPSVFMSHYPGYAGGARHDLWEHYIPGIPPLHDDFDFSQLEHYAFIYGGSELRDVARNVCLMDDPNLRFVFENKAYIHDAIEASGLEAFRPKTILFPRKYTADLAQEIREKIPGNTYVIKAPDLERGEGVVFATNDNLDDILRVVLTLPEDTGSMQRNLQGVNRDILLRMNEFTSMLNSQSNRFMVEEYIPSKDINCEGEIYDATVRSLFLYIRDGGSARYVPIHSYWKIPPQPVSAHDVTLRDRTLSSYSSTRVAAALVEPEDVACINHTLSQIVPNLFNTIITTDYFEVISGIRERSNARFGRSTQWLNYSNSFSMHGDFNLSMYCLEKVVASEVEAARLSHHRAIAYYAKGDDDQAIANFEQTLDIAPNSEAAYFRLARIYAERGDQVKFTELYEASANNFDAFSNMKWFNLLNPSPMFIASSIAEDEELESKVSVDDQAEVFKNEGNEHFMKRRYERAIVCYEKAIALNPSHKSAWLNKGRSHHQLAMSEFAANAYIMALSCDDQYVKAYYFFAKLLYETDRFDLAKSFKSKGLRFAEDKDSKQNFYRLNAQTVAQNPFSVWERKQVYSNGDGQAKSSSHSQPERGSS
ncbi:MAG: tetratricopeptide repeat protein [Gammaproteobacteria bacterium]